MKRIAPFLVSQTGVFIPSTYQLTYSKNKHVTGRRALGMRFLKPIDFVPGGCRLKFMFMADHEKPNSGHILDYFHKKKIFSV